MQSISDKTNRIRSTRIRILDIEREPEAVLALK